MLAFDAISGSHYLQMSLHLSARLAFHSGVLTLFANKIQASDARQSTVVEFKRAARLVKCSHCIFKFQIKRSHFLHTIQARQLIGACESA